MRKSLVFFGAAVLVLAAACGSSSKSSGGSGARKVNAQITPKGCAPATMELPAGPTTFEVVNDGADSITEIELKRGDKIVGEKENLTPGLTGNFTVTLQAGEYELECPGGASATVTVTDTAK